MKTIKCKAVLFVSMIALVLSSCTKDSDVEVPTAKKIIFAENFDNSDLTTTGWIKYSQVGTKPWTQASYKNDGYALFTTYSGAVEALSVSWLISPEIDMDAQTGEKLFFQSCQAYVRSMENSLELYVSSDYDGTNFNAASWQKIDFNLPTVDTKAYLYVDSGIIDLSSYTGKLHFAFKAKGTKTATGGLTGNYQVDNIRIFY